MPLGSRTPSPGMAITGITSLDVADVSQPKVAITPRPVLGNPSRLTWAQARWSHGATVDSARRRGSATRP